MSRGTIFLDVDGVLNPYGGTNKPRQRAGYRKYKITPDRDPSGLVETYPVWLRREHGVELLALAEEIDFELVWATTWEDQANVWIAGKIGLPRLPVVHFTDSPDWKFGPVRRWAANRPLIWFDDDFGLHVEQEVCFRRARHDAQTLLREVSPRVGLVEEDLAAAREWARQLDA